jgi:hypothetical protein
MGWTKRQFIEAALTEIGLADYVFNSTPQDLQTALRRLDTMMADWYERGILLGYPLPDSPQYASLDEQTLVPDRANEGIILNLAMKIAPSYGKQVMPATMTGAREALNTLFIRAARPGMMQFPQQTPAGAGNKQWGQSWGPFLKPPQADDVIVEGGNAIEFDAEY